MDREKLKKIKTKKNGIEGFYYQCLYCIFANKIRANTFYHMIFTFVVTHLFADIKKCKKYE